MKNIGSFPIGLIILIFLFQGCSQDKSKSASAASPTKNQPNDIIQQVKAANDPLLTTDGYRVMYKGIVVTEPAPWKLFEVKPDGTIIQLNPAGKKTTTLKEVYVESFLRDEQFKQFKDRNSLEDKRNRPECDGSRHTEDKSIEGEGLVTVAYYDNPDTCRREIVGKMNVVFLGDPNYQDYENFIKNNNRQ